MKEIISSLKVKIRQMINSVKKNYNLLNNNNVQVITIYTFSYTNLG